MALVGGGAVRPHLRLLRGVSAVALCSVLATPFAAAAQQTAAATGTQLEEIVVTGSRIARANLSSNSPITTITGEDFKATGTINAEKLLNEMPQVVAGLTGNNNLGNFGFSTVDLRGLGTNRTLVLVNGRRVVSSTLEGTVDLNTIPAALIERVDVVTGGASAVYGSDAVAGVVNFILKKDFEGAQFDFATGISGEGDAEYYDYNMTLGGNFADDRGNAVLSVGYVKRTPVLQTDRDFFEVALSDSAGTIIPNINTQTPNGRAEENLSNRFPGRNAIAFGPNGSINYWRGAADSYSVTPFQYLQTPQERYLVSGQARYDIGGVATVFADGTYLQNRSTTQLSGTPVSNIATGVDNPFIPAALAAELAGRPNRTADFLVTRRTAEVGNRIYNHQTDTYRFTVGAEGELSGGWKWDASYGYGTVTRETETRNLISRSRYTAALNCYGTRATPGCVPMNVFGPGTISEAAANYIRVQTVDQTTVELETLAASVTGELFTLPAGDVGVAFGAEHRQEEARFRPDFFSATGDLIGGSNALPVQGSYDVSELFAEALVPLVSNAPFAKYAGLELGARYSDYSTADGVWTYKIGGEYEPVEQVRLRALYQRAIRAPSIAELYEASTQLFQSGITDPCSAANRPQDNPAIARVCQQQGLPASALGTFTQQAQIEIRQTGNPNLRPEKADTYTFGAVFEPVDDLTVSVDYYNIKIEDFISYFGGGLQTALLACFASGDNNSAACRPNGVSFSRAANGNLNPATITRANVSELKTSGVDVEAEYRFAFNNGHSLTTAAQVNWVESWALKPNPGLPIEYEYAGTVGFNPQQGAIPKWRATARATYEVGPVALTYRVRWLDEVELRSLENARALGRPEPTLAIRSAGDIVYHDISARWETTEWLTLNGGVRNVTDRDPPLIPGWNLTNTDVSTYDVIGRFFYLNASVKF